jgi:acyl dehydratase
VTDIDMAVGGPLSVKVDELHLCVGHDLPTSRWLRIEQSRIDAFAEATDDWQWIHVDTERAQTGPYGTTVAHGFLTLSLVAPLLKDMLRVDGAVGSFNYGLEGIRFPAPVRCGDRIRAAGRLAAADVVRSGVKGRLALTIEIEGQPTPACALELIILYRVPGAEPSLKTAALGV